MAQEEFDFESLKKRLLLGFIHSNMTSPEITFSFHLKEANGSGTILVTDGHFDLTYVK